jgi:hypothetical protein
MAKTNQKLLKQAQKCQIYQMGKHISSFYNFQQIEEGITEKANTQKTNFCCKGFQYL